jgi:hypothetical protein
MKLSRQKKKNPKIKTVQPKEATVAAKGDITVT